MHSNNHQIFVKADSESPVYSATCTSEDFEDQNSTENSYSYGTSSENISLDEVLLDELPFLLETFSSDLVPESTDSLPSLSPTSDSASSSLDDNSISSDQNKHEPESQALLPDFKSSNTENSIPPDSSFADSTISFPFKLYFLMNKYSSSKDDSAIVSWSQNGLCFNINNSEKFSQDIIPIFFKRKKIYLILLFYISYNYLLFYLNYKLLFYLNYFILFSRNQIIELSKTVKPLWV